MSEYNISLRYATSLLETAKEKNILDSVSLDIELVSSTIDENPQLTLALASPIVKPDVKISILSEIFGSRISKDSMNFLVFVVDKNREEFLPQIVKSFLNLRDEVLGIVNVEVKTAFEFTGNQKEQLKNNLEKYLHKKVRFKFAIDPNIIGGFVAKVDDTVFDASLKNQLELLKKQFLRGGASLN